MTFPISHKTIFCLDHCTEFSSGSQQMIDLDMFTKTRSNVTLPAISKSLWTCSVESSIEYCRIVWDVYPKGRHIRFLVGDSQDIQFMNSWQEQSIASLMSAFAKVSPPTSSPKTKFHFVETVRQAFESLCELSAIQQEQKSASEGGHLGSVLNKGRIIVITHLSGDSEILKLEKSIYSKLQDVNKKAAQDEALAPLGEVEVIIIHTSPGSKDLAIPPSKRQYGNDLLTCEVHKVTSGQFLSDKLCSLVQVHYELAITTVTGIPMKEEQNANSSANYDVELLHPVAAHADFIKAEGSNPAEKREITLKWCTPRSATTQELQYCTAAHRITPVDINSRPSSCLTNFLLGGRAVMLELPRKSGTKLLSHMLTSHGGEIYIHTLGTGRSSLEDPPSISEGTGGRVTDYRITDFGMFMKDNMLVPYNVPHFKPSSETPLDVTAQNIFRATSYWPLVISATSVFNMQTQLEPLLSIIVKPSISAEQVIECKKVILNLVSMEAKGTPVPVTTGVPGQRGKGGGPRKEEQYRALWVELEHLVRQYCTSPEHLQVLECLLECKKPDVVGAEDPVKVSLKHEIKPNYSTSETILDDPVKPKKLRVAPGLLGKSSLLEILSDNERRKPATRMWVGYNPDTNKTSLYQQLTKKEPKEDGQSEVTG